MNNNEGFVYSRKGVIFYSGRYVQYITELWKCMKFGTCPGHVDSNIFSYGATQNKGI